VLKKASEEFDRGQSEMAYLLRAVVAIPEAHRAVVDGFDTAVGDGDTEEVTSQIVENLVATPGVLGMNDPVFLPDRYRCVREQAGLFQSVTKLGAEDDR
jgi:hypothetical protein